MAKNDEPSNVPDMSSRSKALCTPATESECSTKLNTAVSAGALDFNGHSAVERTTRESDEESSWSESDDETLSQISSQIALLSAEINLSNKAQKDHRRLAMSITELLLQRFQLSRDVSHIREAVAWATDKAHLPETTDLCPDKDRMEHLVLLENCLREQYLATADISDVDTAVSIAQKVAIVTPDGHDAKPSWLVNLADALLYRHELLENGHTTNMDLKESISTLRNAVRLVPLTNPDRPMYTRKFAKALCFITPTRASLEEAISAQAEAANLLPEDHPDKALYLTDLSDLLRDRFDRRKEAVDLDNAIIAHTRAVNLTPTEDPFRSVRLNDLGYLLYRRFERRGSQNDLQRSISYRVVANELKPDDSFDKPDWLSTLGVAYSRRFVFTGELVDIDNAINLQNRAFELLPPGRRSNPKTGPEHKNNLASTYYARFLRLRNIADLDKAISSVDMALELSPEKDLTRARYLHNSGLLLLRRLEQRNDTADLDKAISNQTKAVDLATDKNDGKPLFLTSLGISLRTRFERSNGAILDDIDKSIICHTKGVELAPIGSPRRRICLSDLGHALRIRFERLGNTVDIDKAISCLEQAISLAPEEHSSTCLNLYRLGLSLKQKSRSPEHAADASKAINAFSESAKSYLGHPLTKFRAACEWARLHLKQTGQPSLVAWQTAIDLIPRFVWLGTDISERYDAIVSVGNAINEAVAASIQLKEYELAVEWLEHGRCIVWGQILRLRTSVDELELAHPDIAQQIRDVSVQLDAAGVGQTLVPVRDHETMESTLEEEAQKHRRLADRYEDLIEKARQLPSFDQFLQPQHFSSLTSHNVSGPVVMVNVDEARCDALILKDHRSPMLHIPLDNFSMKTAKTLQETLLSILDRHGIRVRDSGLDSERASMRVPSTDKSESMEHILKILWTGVVHPILSGLKDTWPDGPPHITWCATGPLVFLPLHAAGIYDDDMINGLKPKLHDHTVSSYTPSLTLLAEASKRASQHASLPRILALSQPNTPQYSALPGTRCEVEGIKEYLTHAQYDFKWLNAEQATVSAVLREMESHSWCHFACHGVQHPKDPTKSAFALHDGPLDLRTIMSKSFASAEVAFLSACQTAKGDVKRPEESVHLAAGMLAAGYYTVFGTMWSIKDRAAPLVTKEVYSYLLSSGNGDGPMDRRDRSAYALHRAVRHLREKVEERNFLEWVPFVHFGV